MKQILLIVLGFFLLSGNLFAQCPEPSPSGAYFFTSQTEVDEFLINYPDCTELMGYVNIYNESGTTDPIVNLNGLTNLNKVRVLQIRETNLMDLTGLNNLTEITQTLAVWNNPDLFFLEGLNNLTAIGTGDGFNKLEIYDNPVLFDVFALQNVSGGLIEEARISNNESLFGLQGLDNMNFDLSMFEFNITNNANLTVCSVESVCEFISGGGNAVISGNFAIGPCADLYAVTVECQGTYTECPSGDVTLSTQADVDQFLIDYPTCAVIGGILTIDDNGTDPITNLGGLQNIETVYGLAIKNTTLSDFSGLATLETISGDLEIDNTTLNDLSFLNDFTTIGGGIKILNNTMLSDMEGLSGIEEINGPIEIINNDALVTLSGLENVVTTSITNLIIENNDNLSLCNMDSICIYLANGGDATVSGNDSGCNNIVEVEDSCNTPECPPGDVEFTTQAELDYFLLQYPDCTQITGNMHIGGAEGNYDISNLLPLQNITSIEGNLIIDYTNITNFEGLNNLTEIGGHFGVGHNAIVNYEGLENLVTIGNYFEAYENPELQNFQGLESLTTIFGGVQILLNPELQNFEGMNNLAEVGISPVVSGFADDVGIIQNASLESFAGWENLSTLYASLTIQSNENLSNIGALNGLTEIGHPDEVIEVRIQELPSLASIQGFENLTAIYGTLRIVDLPILSDITPLSNLSTVWSIILGQNDALTDLDGLQSIVSVGYQPGFGDLEIYDNNSLLNFEGINNLEEINGTLRIEGNQSLETLAALGNLEIVGNSFTIRANSSLINLEGLNNLTQTGAYTSATSNFLIWDNIALTSIEELQNLTSVNNSAVSISGNPQLPSLSGLDNIDPNSIFVLELVSSENLSYCEVESVCDFIGMASPEMVHIEGNATGCNNVGEVEDACLLRTEDFAANSFRLYPVPAENKLYIENEYNIPVNSIEVFDMNGKLVWKIAENVDEINISHFPAGVYDVIIKSGKKITHHQKIIKK